MKARRVIPAVIATGLFVTVLSACGGKQNNATQDAAATDTLTIGMTQDLDSMDPAKAESAGTREVLFNVYDGLMKPDTDGNLNPAVASEYVISPDGNRSAVSNHIIMHKPLRLTPHGKNRWASEGNPVDCVICALKSKLFGDVQFDAVVSGINKGANMGTDIVYSGTAAASRQSVLYGKPGIALSVETYDGSWKFAPLADFAAKNLEKLVALCTKEAFVNVNAASRDAYDGVSFTSTSKRDYRDKVDIQTETDGAVYGYFTGGNIRTEGADDSDFAAVTSGRISVSLIQAEPTSVRIPCKNLHSIVL